MFTGLLVRARFLKLITTTIWSDLQMTFFEYIRSDFDAAMRNDPAIPHGFRGFLEIVFCTPGFLAITFHRIFHYMHSTMHIPVLPRFLSLFVRWWTGIEIHPGAVIGSGFFIDHGAGVVIGETSEIGNNVTMYQGVTLGGTGKDKGVKRHPTIGDNVFIGSGAKILGPIKVGSNSRIGANSVVLKNVPENATVTGMRARIVKVNGERVSGDMKMSTEELLSKIFLLDEDISQLKKEIRRLKGEVEPETVQEPHEVEIEVVHRHKK